jgi:hypothetical protein
MANEQQDGLRDSISRPDVEKRCGLGLKAILIEQSMNFLAGDEINPSHQKNIGPLRAALVNL